MTNYIGVVTFVGIYAYHKFRYRTKMIPLHEVDLVSGKAEIDADQQYWFVLFQIVWPVF